MFQKFKSENRIYLKASTKIDDAYYYLIKVPSESQKDSKIEYDVVIRFFTDDTNNTKSNNLRNYYIQFFSNCPSFMYQFAYLYNKKGYLIELLYNKIDANYINMPPKVRNSGMVISYDKSIFFACKYLAGEQFKLLNKPSGFRGNYISPEKFFPLIKDFETVRVTQDIINAEKKIQKELLKDEEQNRFTKNNLKHSQTNVKRAANKIGVMDKIKPIAKNKKITAKRSTYKS